MRNNRVFDAGADRFINGNSRVTILDALIGIQIRKVRLEREFTLLQLGNALDLPYQQIQKYEMGRNRIAASMLLMCSVYMDKPIEHFFTTARQKLEE